jgi:8-oxo-dGTP pyrophosphatase MutT (NUDIX family)
VLEPGESIEQCAARELFEETGLTLSLSATGESSDGWPVFLAEAPAGAVVRLSTEHDQFAWLTLAQAADQTKPAMVRNQLLAAARHVLDQNRPAPVSSPDAATPPSDR